jgi:hypothetical protein
LITKSDAAAIWREAERRHPALAELGALVAEEAAPALPPQPTLREHLA